MGGQRAFTHVGQRRSINDVIAVAGAQQIEEVEPALGGRGPEPGEVFITHLCAEAVAGFVARASVVHRNPGGARVIAHPHEYRIGLTRVVTSSERRSWRSLCRWRTPWGQTLVPSIVPILHP